MRIALVNKYLRPKGGADIVVLKTAALLRDHGHQVVLLGMAPAEGIARELPAYLVSPVDYDAPLTFRQRAGAALRLLYSLEAKRKMRELIGAERPDVVHFNNIYHQLSPSVIAAAAAAGLPTAMTLHDYKLSCPVYSHRRAGAPCEQCAGRRFLNAFRFRCTDGSAAKSLLNTVEMYLHHQVMGVYRKVDVFLSPSRFLRRKVLDMGFRGRILHLPNFVQADRFRPRYDWDGRRIAYLGRLSPEKGLTTLLAAVKGLDVELLIIGTGPQADELKAKAAAENIGNVSFVGYRAGAELHRLLAGCMFTLMPSECYENNPLSVLESFALGKPVVGADVGGIPELVTEDRGALFPPGDREALRERITRLLGDPGAVRAMGRAARLHVERHLNADVFYERLMTVYRGLSG